MKIGVYRRKSGRFQVYFNHEGHQVHLQRLPWGKALDSESDVTLLVAWLKRFGYSPEKFGKDQPFQFPQAYQTWLQSSNASPEWVERLRWMGRKFFIPYFKKQDLRKIQTAHIQAFYASLKEKYSPKYCKNLLNELHALLHFHRKALKEFPDFPKIEVQEPVIRWLTSQEQDGVFQHIPEIDLPIFECMRWYGVRTNEASGLLRKNVYLDKGYFVVAAVLRRNGQVREVTKTHKLRILPIVELTRWIFELPDNGSLFLFTKKGRPYTNKMLNLIWNRANRLSGVTPINLYNGTRHSFATQRLNAGFGLDEVRHILGHSSSKMTERYAKYTIQSLENIISYSPVIVGAEVKLLENKRENKDGGKGLAPKPFSLRFAHDTSNHRDHDG